jgi:hypothetical protein
VAIRTGVDVVVGDRGQRVADHPAAGHGGRHLLGLLREGVADRDDLRAGDAAVEPGDVVGTHHPDAQDGDPQVAGRDVGQVRERPGAGLCGGHARSSSGVAGLGVPICSDGS